MPYPWQRGELRPKFDGAHAKCHTYRPELSGGTAPPNKLEQSAPSLTVSLHAVGGLPPANHVPPPSSHVHVAAASRRKRGPSVCCTLALYADSVPVAVP
jgi:hypothetical protein|eukprot:4938448-Prymnesium_polylepis.3